MPCSYVLDLIYKDGCIKKLQNDGFAQKSEIESESVVLVASYSFVRWNAIE